MAGCGDNPHPRKQTSATARLREIEGAGRGRRYWAREINKFGDRYCRDWSRCMCGRTRSSAVVGRTGVLVDCEDEEICEAILRRGLPELSGTNDWAMDPAWTLEMVATTLRASWHRRRLENPEADENNSSGASCRGGTPAVLCSQRIVDSQDARGCVQTTRRHSRPPALRIWDSARLVALPRDSHA